jgi:hypothetical protein
MDFSDLLSKIFDIFFLVSLINSFKLFIFVFTKLLIVSFISSFITLFIIVSDNSHVAFESRSFDAISYFLDILKKYICSDTYNIINITNIIHNNQFSLNNTIIAKGINIIIRII